MVRLKLYSVRTLVRTTNQITTSMRSRIVSKIKKPSFSEKYGWATKNTQRNPVSQTLRVSLKSFKHPSHKKCYREFYGSRLTRKVAMHLKGLQHLRR